MAGSEHASRNTLKLPHKSIDYAQGKTIGPYTISSFFKEGSQATLFNVTDRQARPFIMRVYFDGEAPDPAITAAFSCTTDKRLCKILAKGTYGDHQYDVVSFLSPVPDIRTLSQHEQMEWIRKEADAVKAVHATGYAHYDIKAEHFMRDLSGTVVLIDLASARKIGTASPPMPSQFLPPDAYTQPVRKESDLFSFGIALIEQFVPGWLRGKSRDEIVRVLSTHEELRLAVNKLPGYLQTDVKALLSDAPAARYACSWFDSDAPRSRRRAFCAVADSKTGTNTNPNVCVNTPPCSLEHTKEKVKDELVRIVCRCNSGVFRDKVQRSAKQTNLNDAKQAAVFLRFLQTIPSGTQTNYSNIRRGNVLEALYSKVVTSANTLSKKDPIGTLEEYKRSNTFYIFEKKLIEDLDKTAAEVTNQKNERAWATLKTIGIILGVIAGVAAVVAIIILLFYVLIAVVIVCALIAAFAGS